jgi:thiamine monophosphate kinase
MAHERQLVEKIARTLPAHRAASSRLKLGIGDDAAIVSLGGRTEWVLSCDTFLEDVHFRLKSHPPD